MGKRRTASDPDPRRRDVASFVVLRGPYGDLCLWPAESTIPEGWQRVSEPSTYEDCLALVRAEAEDPPERQKSPE